MNTPPANPNTAKQQVMALFQQRRFAEARTLCTALCQQNPADAHAWFLLSTVHGQLGEFAAAEKCWKKVVKLEPDHPAALYHLGLTYQSQGKTVDAIESYRKALKLQPGMFEALNNLGALLRSLNRLDEALELLQHASRLQPTNPVILNNLGLALKDKGRLDDAVGRYESAIQAQPAYPEAHFNLGNIQQLQGKTQEAKISYQRALTYQANFPMALINLGKILLSEGNSADALQYFQRALQIQPGSTDALTAIADVHEKLGDFENAYAQLQAVMDQGVQPANAAVTYATVCRRLGRHAEAIARLEPLTAQAGLPSTLRQELHFKLGDLYDDQAQYDEAFRHYQQANRLSPFPFDEQAAYLQFQSLNDTFNADTLPAMARARNASERPLFIVGMPRSGTSLVEQILASHPDVYGGGELDQMGDLLNSFPKRFGQPYPYAMSRLGADDLDSLAEVYLDRLATLSPEAKRVTDKMPHNFLHLGLIARLFPRARVIHCQREPMDTCLSIYFHNFNANHPYASDLTRLGGYYRRYQGLMQHWKQSLDIPILDVQYETLVTDQEAESRRLIAFCGLEWDDCCLRYHESKRRVNTPSYDQVRQPMYRSSIGRWQAYARNLDPLKRALE